MKKRALLIVGLALLIAAAGIAYAHWTETLTVNAQVNTGNITTHWKLVFTNDDGVANRVDGEPAPSTEYTFGNPTSNDPSSASAPLGEEPYQRIGAPTRYDKDVADCIATINAADAHGFTLIVDNAYPSYHCTVLSLLGNQGTVPVKVQAVHTWVYRNGSVFYPNADPALVGTPLEVATWYTQAGHDCGEQVDPGDFNATIATLHIGEMAEPGDQFIMHQQIELRNWNEWLEGDCSFTFNEGTDPMQTQ